MRQLRLCIRKSLAIYLIMALLVLGSLPTDLMAALIPSDLDAAGLMVEVEGATGFGAGQEIDGAFLEALHVVADPRDSLRSPLGFLK